MISNAILTSFPAPFIVSVSWHSLYVTIPPPDPGAAGGIDMDSDLIEEMATDIPNLCGVKLTCGNVGKLTRIAGVVSSPSFAEKHPRKNKDAP